MHNGALARSRRSDGLSRGPIEIRSIEERRVIFRRKIERVKSVQREVGQRREEEEFMSHAYDSINFERICPTFGLRLSRTIEHPVSRSQVSSETRRLFTQTRMILMIINAWRFFSLDIGTTSKEARS